MKIKLANVKGPIELKVLPGPKGKVVFDEEGCAVVPDQVGKILLGPGHNGEGYSLVEEVKKEGEAAKPADIVTQDKPDERLVRKEKVAKTTELNKAEMKEFIGRM